MPRILLQLILVLSSAAVSLAAANESANGRSLSIPKGAVPHNETGHDPNTKLPKRIVHTASGITFVLIPAGEFVMGSPEGEAGRSSGERQHRRVIRRPFYLGETEVTVGQFRRFVQATQYRTDAERGTPDGGHGLGAFSAMPAGEREWNAAANWQNPFVHLPDYRIDDDHPVVQVSWNDAQKFCTHFGVQLPTEAQWEYACRAGGQTRYPWGDAEAGGHGFANVGDESLKKRFRNTNVHFPFDDSAAIIAPVGRYKSNAWGLKDMIGNVEEWCQDAHGRYPNDGADESAAEGAAEVARVLRGGAWIGNAGTSRSATRIGMAPASRRDFQGFRVALRAAE